MLVDTYVSLYYHINMIEQIQAISDPTRFAILELVKEKELPAGRIAENFSHLTRPAISQHIRVLKDHDLLLERREGTRRYYSVNADGFSDIRKFLEQFWQPKLRKLKSVAEDYERKNK